MTLDFSNIIQQAQAMQDKVKTAKDRLSKMRFLGVAGAGLMQVEIDGQYCIVSVKIDRDFFNNVQENDERIAGLQELFKSATNEAIQNLEKTSRAQMKSLVDSIEPKNQIEK